jgi:Putative zincin peptidase
MARLLRLSEVRETAEGEQPPGYALFRKGNLNLGLLSVLSLVALPPAFVFFAFITAPLGGPFDLRGGEFSIPVDPVGLVLVTIAALVILPVVHELVHGAVAALCGGKPVYGIGPGVAFCHFREFVGTWPYAAILVAPLLLLSIVGVVLMPVTPGLLRGPLLAILVTNASGAVGDIASLAQLSRLPPDALIADTSHGFEVYARTVEGDRR